MAEHTIEAHFEVKASVQDLIAKERTRLAAIDERMVAELTKVIEPDLPYRLKVDAPHIARAFYQMSCAAGDLLKTAICEVDGQ